MKEPVDHIERPRLPWRSPDEPSITECGYSAVQVKTLTRSDFQRRLKEYGAQRTAVLTCMTCMQTSQRWSDWETDPRQAIEREIQWEGRWNKDRGTRLANELRAIRMLIHAHYGQFQTYLHEVEGTVDFAVEKFRRGKNP